MKKARLFAAFVVLGVCSCEKESSHRISFAEHEKVISKLVLEKAELTSRLSLVTQKSDAALAALKVESESGVRELQAEVQKLSLEKSEGDKDRIALENQLDILKRQLADVQRSLDTLTDNELKSFGHCEGVLAKGNLEEALKAFVVHNEAYPAGLKSEAARQRITELRSKIFGLLTDRIRKGEIEYSEWEQVLKGLNQTEIHSIIGKPSMTRQVTRGLKPVGEIHTHNSASYGKPLEILYEKIRPPVLLIPRKRMEWEKLLVGEPTDFVLAIFGNKKELEALKVHPQKGIDSVVVEGRSTDVTKMTIEFAHGRLFVIEPN